MRVRRAVSYNSENVEAFAAKYEYNGLVQGWSSVYGDDETTDEKWQNFKTSDTWVSYYCITGKYNFIDLCLNGTVDTGNTLSFTLDEIKLTYDCVR